MDSATKTQYEGQSLELRAQLKTWEGDWVKAHGNKPSRDDIKANPDIAQKYKQYNKVRDILSGKAQPESDNPPERKRKEPAAKFAPQTPSKRSKLFHTPRKAQAAPADLPVPAAENTTPSISRTLFSPSLPTHISPTPQRDGKVLGLFDLLGKTPSSTDKAVASPASVAPTPSKKRGSITTPTTKGRHIDLYGISTPLNERRGDVNPRTPSSSASKQWATPAFLRRTAPALPPVDENGEWKVAPLRLPKKPIVRSLSSMIADLKKREDEAHQEDEDAMREMEMEAEGIPVVKKPETLASVPEGKEGEKTSKEKTDENQEPEEPDQQEKKEPKVPKERPVLLGGFDDESDFDSSEEEQLDRGQPLRVWKKKGQKRTTRLTKMKPTRVKRPVAVPDDEDSPDEFIEETQYAAKAAGDGEARDEGLEELSGSDFDGEGSESEDEGKTLKAKGKKPAKGKAADKKEEKEGVVKKAVRMVKASANANFKRLKLRNKGGKAGPGYNSRFRRKR